MRKFFSAVLLAMIFVSGYAQKKAAKPAVLFTVNKEAVSADEFIYLYKKNHQAKEDFTDAKIEEYFNLFVNFKLKVAEARTRGIDKTAEFTKEYNSYKDELRKPYLPEGKILDSLTKLTYARLQYDVSAAHILIGLTPDATPEDTAQAHRTAITLKKRAEEGEDFGSLAALYSEEPSAQTTKGNLGYFTALQMVYPFEEAAYNGKPGDIVGPIRTRFGYHVLKIGDRRPSRGEVEVSHVMLRTGGARDNAKTKNLAFEIHAQLQGGADWDELCKQFSEDPGSKDTGGRLRPFGVGAMNNLPEFDQTAFALKNPGEISDPFQTQLGWHIIRLERKIPLPTLEEATASLKSRVSRDERVQLSKRSMMVKLKKDLLFVENEAVKTKVVALADTSLVKGRWKVAATFKASKETLFTLQGKKILASEFLSYVQKEQRPNSLTPEAYLELLYTNFTEATINAAFENNLVSTNPDFELLLKEYYEGILLFDIMEKEVWKKASEDSVGQRAYFTANASKYQAKERIAGTILYTGTEKSTRLVIDAYKKGDTTELNKTIKAEVLYSESGYFQREDRPFLAEMKWETGLHVVQSGTSYYLVEVNAMVPAGPMKFEEARATVISDYQNKLEEQWLTDLRKKYPMKVNDKTKKDVVEKLKS